MPASDHLLTLYSHHFGTIERMLDLAASLNEEDYRQNPGYGRGSIHELLFHLLATDHSWRVGLESGARPQPLDPESYPDLSSLRPLLVAEQEAWRTLLGGLTEADIEAEMQMSAGPDRSFTVARWRVLHHVLLHGMQHLAEVAQLLTNKGQSPGDIDFIFYL